MANEKRLIDANAAMNGIIAQLENEWGYDGIREDVQRILHSTPTVDAVEVVHGRWVSRKHKNILGDFFRFHCSECGEDKPNSIHINYCPNCGAKMDGDGDG